MRRPRATSCPRCNGHPAGRMAKTPQYATAGAPVKRAWGPSGWSAAPRRQTASGGPSRPEVPNGSSALVQIGIDGSTVVLLP